MQLFPQNEMHINNK